MISPTSQQTRSLNWLRKHRPLDGSVEIRDVTSAYAGINVIGPHAPQLLYDVSGINTSRHEFKQMTCKVRMNHCGSHYIALMLSFCKDLYTVCSIKVYILSQCWKNLKLYLIWNNALQIPNRSNKLFVLHSLYLTKFLIRFCLFQLWIGDRCWLC